VIGRTISHYRIVAPLGQGGMGVVYEADDLTLGRRLAVKFLRPETATDPIAIERGFRERDSWIIETEVVARRVLGRSAIPGPPAKDRFRAVAR
jgi:serine/threonine protein kinase